MTESWTPLPLWLAGDEREVWHVVQQELGRTASSCRYLWHDKGYEHPYHYHEGDEREVWHVVQQELGRTASRCRYLWHDKGYEHPYHYH